jgi:hypothetical protein
MPPPPPSRRTPADTLRGFALRVVVIAVATLIVLGIADFFHLSLDPFHAPHPHHFQTPH